MCHLFSFFNPLYETESTTLRKAYSVPTGWSPKETAFKASFKHLTR
jgi:hypothetical protein